MQLNTETNKLILKYLPWSLEEKTVWQLSVKQIINSLSNPVICCQIIYGDN